MFLKTILAGSVSAMSSCQQHGSGTEPDVYSSIELGRHSVRPEAYVYATCNSGFKCSEDFAEATTQRPCSKYGDALMFAMRDRRLSLVEAASNQHPEKRPIK